MLQWYRNITRFFHLSYIQMLAVQHSLKNPTVLLRHELCNELGKTLFITQSPVQSYYMPMGQPFQPNSVFLGFFFSTLMLGIDSVKWELEKCQQCSPHQLVKILNKCCAQLGNCLTNSAAALSLAVSDPHIETALRGKPQGFINICDSNKLWSWYM